MAIVAAAALDASSPPARAAGEAQLDSLRRSRLGDVFPDYPGAPRTPMGMLDANGNAMEMAFFETRDSPGEVLAFYGRTFEARGHSVEYVGEEEGGTVSYYDSSLGQLVSIHAMLSGDPSKRRTLAFPSIVDTPDGVSLSAAPIESLPRPEGATAVLRLDDRSMDRSGGARTMTQIAPGSPTEVASFYREALPSHGFALASSQSESETQVLEFSGSARRVSIAISPLQTEGKPESVVAIIMEGLQE
ncbi:MAG: hypothetical protein ACOX6T_11950 [Myxococcales bacterium]